MLQSRGHKELAMTEQLKNNNSLEGLMLKLKVQNFGYLMPRADSLEKTLMLGKVEGRRKGSVEHEIFGWHH